MQPHDLSERKERISSKRPSAALRKCSSNLWRPSPDQAGTTAASSTAVQPSPRASPLRCGAQCDEHNLCVSKLCNTSFRGWDLEAQFPAASPRDTPIASA